MIRINAKMLALCSVIIAIINNGCKKVETVTVQQPTACFTSQINNQLFVNNPVQQTVNFIDSPFVFKNCSDSGADINYEWTFGDGTTSTEKNPSHKFTKRGQYNVTLKVIRQNIASNSIQSTVSVILGQKHISLAERVPLLPVAICETQSGDFMLLANYNYGQTYYLFTLDSLMRQKSSKAFPSGFRFWSMLQLNDGNYLLTGNTTGNARNNELVKIQTDGTVIWKKSYNTQDNLLQAVQTPDGGFAIIGERPGSNPGNPIAEYQVIIKTDNNGNSEWQKQLNLEGITRSLDIIAETDGLVFGGSKPDMSFMCQYCDSVAFSKIDYNGNLQWSKKVAWGLNYYMPSARTTKLINGTYAVASQGQNGIFYFSSSGQFLDRKLSKYSIAYISDAGDGNLLALQTESGNGFRITTDKYSAASELLWSAGVEGRQALANGGIVCCTNSNPLTLLTLRNGGYLVCGNRYIYTADANSNYNVGLLLQLDNNGKPK